MIDKPMVEDALRDLVYTKKEELVSKMKVKGTVANSDPKLVEFGILRKRNKKGGIFCRNISRQRKTRENVSPLMSGQEISDEVHSKGHCNQSLSIAVFSAGKRSLQEYWIPGTGGKVQIKEDQPLEEEGQVREQFNKVDIHKSMGPAGVDP